MESNVNVLFVGWREFKSKKGNDCKVIDILEINKQTGLGKCSSMFVDEITPLVKGLRCGDEVEATLSIESASEPVKLKSINKRVNVSPYFSVT